MFFVDVSKFEHITESVQKTQYIQQRLVYHKCVKDREYIG